MKTTATYDVMYVGQLRFVECVDLHKPLLKNAKNIYGVFVKDLIDSWNVNLGASYSCDNNITFNDAIDYFKKSTGTLDVTVIDSKQYNNFIDTTKFSYVKAQRFLMMADFIKDTDSDFVIVMSTDLILNTSFVDDARFFDYFDKLEPNVFTKITPHPKHLKIHFVIFNSKGIKQLKNIWQTSYKKFVSEGVAHVEKVETTWETLLTYSSVNIKDLQYPLQENPFRPTMNFEQVKKLDFNYISKKQSDWREYKDAMLKIVKYRPPNFLSIPFNQSYKETYESSKQ